MSTGSRGTPQVLLLQRKGSYNVFMHAFIHPDFLATWQSQKVGRVQVALGSLEPLGFPEAEQSQKV